MTKTTRPQREAIARLWKRVDYDKRLPYRFFRAHYVMPTFGCDGAVAVKWCGMYICVERDGYSHS